MMHGITSQNKNNYSGGNITTSTPADSYAPVLPPLLLASKGSSSGSTGLAVAAAGALKV
jgi:hypothetical protein